MGSTSSIVTTLRRIPLWEWFVGFGAIELAIALTAAHALHAPPQVLRILLPALPLFFSPAMPTGITAVIVEGAILFGSSFVIWGTAGLIAGLLIRWSWLPK